ncbi:zinc finger protein 106 isoform X2 [Clupea harengus]|uniref:Zinc finger protein 106 isoform X2 n=1 Tax=Clupea harengus TaxID=7950 RepID=A0A6P8G856_CLUHA|nr:zinc finger protein 106 isoform X2 [Clupea harengus]
MATMGKEKKCILCEIVYSSKQEMDEHMRSMLHHRELENLRGRDCGHECRVCGVKVKGLTDYADHISSPVHKQCVEAHERQTRASDQEEEYFDKELVQLIEKRRELIRLQETAARQEREEEEQRKRQQQERRGSKPWLRQNKATWDWNFSEVPPPPRGWWGDMSSWQKAWGGGNSDRGGWHHHQSRHSKSATWHAEEPPNFQNWSRADCSGGTLPGQASSHGGRQNDYRGNPEYLRGKNWGGREGGNSRDKWWRPPKEPLQVGQQPESSRDLSTKSLKSFKSAQSLGRDNPKYPRGQDGPRKGYHSREGSSGELDQNKGPGPKADKHYRWAPYPSSKLNDVPPLVDGQSSSMENDPGRGGRHPEWHLRSRQHLPSEHHNLDQDYRKIRHQSFHQNSGSTTSESTTSESPTTTSPCSNKKVERPTEHMEKAPLPYSSRADLSRTSSQDSVHLRTTRHEESGVLSPASGSTASATEQERLLSDMLRKAKETLLDKRPSAEPWREQSTETVLHIQELDECVPSTRSEADQDQGKSANCQIELPVSEGDSAADRCPPGSSYASSQTECMSLQSVQVSTSTADREDEEEVKEEEDESMIATAQALRTADEGFSSDSNTQRGDASTQAPCDGNATVPSLSKLALPACLKRDLSRHITTKGKAGPGHEPNLNIARRIRNVSGTRKNEAEKDSGLKPILRELISSTGSRRNVNWDQVYQEVSRKKQEKGKGLPRFGIEMVSNEQENAAQMEGEEPLCEGYHWESLLGSSLAPLPSRKRSLSESSLAPDRTSASLSLFSTPSNVRDARPSFSQSDPGPKEIPGQNLTELLPGPTQAAKDARAQAPESVEGDSSCMSGTELNECHSGGKKRRAAGEVPTVEMACAERKNKRRKLKGKKERSHVDQLLAVSLREEELNGALQGVDQNLIQARAALQAAYMEVQRLLVVKQQVTMEMSTLRTRRIDILKGMQDDLQHTSFPRRSSVEEIPGKVPTAAISMAVAASSPFSPLPETPAFNQGQPVCQNHAAAPLSPLSPAQPTPTTTTQTLVIKLEPLSPCTVPEVMESAQSPVPKLHSTTPEIPAFTAPLSGLDLQCTSVEMVELRRSSADLSAALSSCAPMLQSSTASSRRSSRALDATLPQPLLAEGSGLCPPTQLEQAKAVKKVRKLKKKRMLRQAQGTSPPMENSDSESERELPASRTLMRKLRPRRRASGSHVSTSTSPSIDKQQQQQQEEENNGNHDSGVKGESAEGLATARSSPPTLTQLKLHASDSSELEMVELHQAAAAAAAAAAVDEVISIDISDQEDVKMEVGAAKATSLANTCCQVPAMPEVRTKEELPKVACNEVTSTSEMPKASAAVKTDEKYSTVLAGRLRKSSAGVCEAGEEQKAEPTEGMFEGHQEAVHDMQIHEGLLYTCSGDRTIRAFCLSTRQCVSVFEGHSSKVNCILLSSGPGLAPRLYSGSSDQTVRCYSLRTGECVEQLSLPDRVLCLHSRWKVLFVGLANGSVMTFSLKTNRQLEVFDCHGPRAVSCLATAQEGARRILLVGSYDSTISVRDAKNGLLLRTLEGHSKTVLCMKVVNDLVFSGSSDQSVHAHNIHTGELVRIYKGHSHAVTVVAILGKVMVTACLDKLVRVYELQSHDRLQVYGGHSDMTMCMVIHKSMIYTGCYDGAVRAVKLNLIQNYRCLWHGCSLIFGVMEHLQQHLLQDHATPNLQTLKCRWKNCDCFFSARNGSKQGLEKHMQKHAEDDSKMEP